MKLTPSLAPRLLAGFGLAALLTGAGLFASSRPAHTAGGPIAVTVGNVVQNSDVDNPDQQPFVRNVTLLVLKGDTDSRTFSVPAGKRLVVETVTAYRSAVAVPSANAQVYVQAQAGGTNGLFASTLLTSSRRLETEPIRFRADPSTEVRVGVLLSGSVASEEDEVTISGYLVNVPSRNA